MLTKYTINGKDINDTYLIISFIGLYLNFEYSPWISNSFVELISIHPQINLERQKEIATKYLPPGIVAKMFPKPVKKEKKQKKEEEKKKKEDQLAKEKKEKEEEKTEKKEADDDWF